MSCPACGTAWNLRSGDEMSHRGKALSGLTAEQMGVMTRYPAQLANLNSAEDYC